VERVSVVDVALDPRSGGARALYTYLANEGAGVGDAVFVPVGNRPALGFVAARYDATAEDLGFPLENLKPVQGRVEGLSLPEPVVDLARFVAEEYLASLPVALAPAIPPGVRDRLVTAWTRTDAPVDADTPLTPLQKEVLRTLDDEGGTMLERKSKKLEAKIVRALRLLQGKGLVARSLRVAPPTEHKQEEPLLRLTPDEERIEGFFRREGKKRPAQALTLMRLQGAEGTGFTSAEIRAMAGVTETTVKALVDAGLLERVSAELPYAPSPPPPNAYQRLAIDAVAEAVKEREARPFLLFGVTGSGKTEVYLRAAAAALREGRQVLYVVPEIALAAQAISQLRERFGAAVAVLHSDLPPTERLKNWLRIQSGEASVVLGARSALFAPLGNVGLVILDEEHEGTYKQESAPRYHAKAIARFLGRRHRCPVVLGSATPSIESFYEAEREELTLLSLPERAASARLPEVTVRDLAEGYRAGSPSILTEPLREAIVRTLERGEQTILFLNRRAYAPFVICRECGKQTTCPNCAVSLSYHRRDARLRCHHCGFQQRPPEKCPSCGGTRIAPFGIGTEKVEEAVAEEFAPARVARLDRDVARRQGALEEVLARFRSGETQILVGTQMVAKGLDFPNVTLVGVIAADTSLNIPDFRSSERTFQLLSQVAGRAGRGRSPGSVVIQTFNPEHPSILAAQRHEYIGIYERLRSEREMAGYPPFRRLVNVLLTGENRAEVVRAAEEAAERLSTAAEVEVLGPVDCAVERIQNRWRRHLLLKLPPDAHPSAAGNPLLGFEPKDVQVVVDVDPQTML
jgi:primosomal protein N' (replication factor Y) (superfamily II helicase)